MFQQKGLGFVEVVMALVVLAILASTAIPSFVTDQTTARQAAIDGVAGSLSSASAINYTVRSISHANGIAITNCKDVANALEGSLSSEYRIEGSPVTPGSRIECKVMHERGEWAEFVAQGIS